MREGEASRTAYGAALLRAAHQTLDGGDVFVDPLAWRILGYGPVTHGVAEAVERSGEPLRRFIAGRHRFAEDALAAAVEGGTRQVVLLGAGLDTFSLRFAREGVRVIEVDAPTTARLKQERLAASGIPVPDGVCFVEVDFEQESFLDRLATVGFDTDQPTFYLWLGVVPYLGESAVRATLAAIAATGGAGGRPSEVVLDHPVPSRAASALHARVAAIGEPILSSHTSEQMARLLDESGLEVVESLGRRALAARYSGAPEAADGSVAEPQVVHARVRPRSPEGQDG